jgi:hypothetical protein
MLVLAGCRPSLRRLKGGLRIHPWLDETVGVRGPRMVGYSHRILTFANLPQGSTD